MFEQHLLIATKIEHGGKVYIYLILYGILQMTTDFFTALNMNFTNLIGR